MAGVGVYREGRALGRVGICSLRGPVPEGGRESSPPVDTSVLGTVVSSRGHERWSLLCPDDAFLPPAILK